MFGSTHAADVADGALVTFQPATPAKAAEVNGNFTVLKGAVNSKQDKISAGCSDGEFIRKINADGTVVCAMTQNDSVYVLGEQFVNDADTNPACVLQHGATTWTYYSSGTGCSAYTRVIFADKIKLTGLYCIGLDASTLAGAQMSATLFLLDNTTAVFSTNSSIEQNGGTFPDQLYSGTVINSEAEDVDYTTTGPAYLLRVNFGSANLATVGKNLALWNCEITYTNR